MFLRRVFARIQALEFNDYIQPNFALAEGSLDANVFQHGVYLNKFATEHKLALTALVTVPTAPIAIYSKKHASLKEVAAGSTDALPNDPTNQARALVLLDQLGWIRLRENFDESLNGILECIHLVDDGFDAVLVEEGTHAVERLARRNSDPANGRLAEDQRQRRLPCGITKPLPKFAMT